MECGKLYENNEKINFNNFQKIIFKPAYTLGWFFLFKTFHTKMFSLI